MDLKKYFPNARADLLPPIEALLQDESKNKLIRAGLAAQLAHESDGFKTVEEYASGKAYEGRKDLGNVNPGDGRKYKGRGYIQCTGRYNYKAAAKALGLDLIAHPELLLQPNNAMLVSQWYWGKHGLDKHALLGDIVTITKKINGGLNGLESRKKYLEIFKGILHAV